MSRDFLYVIEVWKDGKLIFDSIRCTALDAYRRRKQLETTFIESEVVTMRYRRERTSEPKPVGEKGFT